MDELTKALEIVIHHRWRARWPAEYERWASDAVIFAFVKRQEKLTPIRH
jgi:hypothetical protein